MPWDFLQTLMGRKFSTSYVTLPRKISLWCVTYIHVWLNHSSNSEIKLSKVRIVIPRHDEVGHAYISFRPICGLKFKIIHRHVPIFMSGVTLEGQL